MHIANNIRLVPDILDDKELIDDNANILFLDLYMAFDTVEFTFESLHRFGFGCPLVKIVQTFFFFFFTKVITAVNLWLNGVS